MVIKEESRSTASNEPEHGDAYLEAVAEEIHRLTNAERKRAGAKALGYDNRAIGWHYMKGALVIATLGALIGILGSSLSVGRHLKEVRS